jgi:hypothetical protein
MVEAFKILLISGVPATGKSGFARWLQKKKSFLHFDVELPGVLERAGLQDSWEQMFLPTGSVMPFLHALHNLQRPVVIDWGFPPHCLPVIKALKERNVEVWWFTGKREIARSKFCERGVLDPQLFDAQMNRIELNWLQIAAVVGEHVIETLKPNGDRVSPEIISGLIFRSTES